MVALGVGGPPRILLALGFVTFVPGWAVLGHSRVVDGVSKIALAVAASLTICTATALAMAWLRSWHPFILFYALAAASAVSVLRPVRHHAPPSPAAPEPAAPAPPPAATAATAPTPEPAAPAELEPAHRPRPAQPRRHTVRSENLRLDEVSVRVVFPTRSPYTAKELTDLFAAVNGRYPFVDFHRDGDAGAVMETNGARRLEVRRGYLDYSEVQADVRKVQRHAVELLGQAQRLLGVQFLASPSCHLRATWHTGPNSVGGDVSGPFARAAGVVPEDHGLLSSTGAVGVGLRFTGQSAEPRHNWQVTMEPNGQDGHVVIDVATDSDQTADGPDAAGEHLEAAHRFLTKTVVRFVESVVEPPTDEH